MTKKSSPRAARDRATRYHSLIVRARGQCERCGETSTALLQCAHIIKRSRTATRTDLTNAWCLCMYCHRLVDSNSLEWGRLVQKTIGIAACEELMRRAEEHTRSKVKFDWVAERDRLRELWKQTEAVA